MDYALGGSKEPQKIFLTAARWTICLCVRLLTLPPNPFPLQEWGRGLVWWSKPQECVEKDELARKIRAGRTLRQVLLEVDVITSSRLMGGEPGESVAGEHRVSRNQWTHLSFYLGYTTRSWLEFRLSC